MNEKFSSVKTLLFDYGGTLDTNGRHWSHVLWEGYVHAGVPVTEEAFREAYVYGERYLGDHAVIEPQDDFYALLLKKIRLELGAIKQPLYNKERYIDQIATYCNTYVLRNLMKTRTLLSELKQHYTLGLVSNFYGNLSAVLKAYGLDDCFQVVIESAVVGYRKPDSTIYALGVMKTGGDVSETVVIGDSFGKDILPARLLGCRTIWLKGESWKPEQNDESLPDAVITDLSGLRDLLV